MVPVTAGCLQYPFSCPLIINGSRIFSREQAAQWKTASLSPSIEGEQKEKIQLLGLHLKRKEPPLVSCFPVPLRSLAANRLRAILHPRKRVTPEKTEWGARAPNRTSEQSHTPRLNDIFGEANSFTRGHLDFMLAKPIS